MIYTIGMHFQITQKPKSNLENIYFSKYIRRTCTFQHNIMGRAVSIYMEPAEDKNSFMISKILNRAVLDDNKISSQHKPNAAFDFEEHEHKYTVNRMNTITREI